MGLCLACLFPSHSKAQPPQQQAEANHGSTSPSSSEKIIVISAHGQWKYANHYFRSSQWPHAVFEYERFIFYFPQDPRIPLAHYRTGIALLNQDHPQDAREQFQQVLAHAQTPTDLTFQALFKIGDCLSKLNSPQQAAHHLNQVAEMTDDPEIKAEALYRSGWLLLDDLEIDQARSLFDRIPESQRLRFTMDPLLSAIGDSSSVPRKNPTVAGSLALLPGAGYLYLGRYQDAWISLLAVGGLGWAAYEAFDNDSPVIGSLLGITGAGFYLGNIHGSVTSAHKANQRQTRRFIDKLRQTYKVQLSMDMNQPIVGLILSGRF